MSLQEATRVRRFACSDIFRRPRDDDLAAGVAPFRAEVDDVVSGFDDVEVVPDQNRGIPRIDKPIRGLEQPFDVGEIKAGRGLVQSAFNVWHSKRMICGLPRPVTASRMTRLTAFEAN